MGGRVGLVVLIVATAFMWGAMGYSMAAHHTADTPGVDPATLIEGVIGFVLLAVTIARLWSLRIAPPAPKLDKHGWPLETPGR